MLQLSSVQTVCSVLFGNRRFTPALQHIPGLDTGVPATDILVDLHPVLCELRVIARHGTH